MDLIVVSIGKPEIGKQLIDHLEVENGEDWIFVDPENKLYDALELLSGVDTTFFSIETPFAFRDRFFGLNGREDGMKDLLNVLGKWKDAVFIPPKLDQSFQRKFLYFAFCISTMHVAQVAHDVISETVTHCNVEGGVFVFKGAGTAFAYYDASAGAHLEVSKAVQKALEVAK